MKALETRRDGAGRGSVQDGKLGDCFSHQRPLTGNNREANHTMAGGHKQASLNLPPESSSLLLFHWLCWNSCDGQPRHGAWRQENKQTAQRQLWRHSVLLTKQRNQRKTAILPKQSHAPNEGKRGPVSARGRRDAVVVGRAEDAALEKAPEDESSRF